VCEIKKEEEEGGGGGEVGRRSTHSITILIRFLSFLVIQEIKRPIDKRYWSQKCVSFFFATSVQTIFHSDNYLMSYTRDE
jgi:hypothetical protein